MLANCQERRFFYFRSYTCKADDLVRRWARVTNHLDSICNEPIYCISAQEQGEVIASGTKAGWLTIMHLGNGLINLQHNEKALFVLAIERGVKKEKILESKEREKKLMQKKLLEGIQDKSEHEENSKTVEAVLEAQKLFFDIIEKEIIKLQESSLQSQFNDTRKSKQLTFSEDGESFHTVKELDIKTVMVSELAKSIPFTTQGQVAMSYVQDKQNDEDFKSSKAATVEKHLPVIVSIEQFPSTVPTVQLESKSEAPLPVNPSEQLQHNSSAQTGNVLADISSKFLSKPQSEALPEHEKQLKIELRETDGTNHVASHAAEQPEETMSGSIA